MGTGPSASGCCHILVRGSSGGTTFVLGIENKIDSPEGDNQLCRYERGLAAQFARDNVVRLRVDTRHSPQRHKAVARALSRTAGFDLPEKGQRTVVLKSTNRLPSVLDKPDTVTDWIVRLQHVRDAIRALDSVLV